MTSYTPLNGRWRMDSKESVAARYGKRTKYQGKRTTGATEDRLGKRIMVCGGLFLLLVGLKLALPAQTQALQTSLRQALGHNMDVTAVFSTVGTLFGGETSPAAVVDEVYQTVFGMEEVQEDSLVILPMVPETTPAQTQDETSATVLYSQENLPENVYLEQTVLGFAYGNPLPGGTISSPFGYRVHPMDGEDAFHYGIDIDGQEGDVILAFAEGTVRAVGESSSYGKYLMLEHSDGYTTLYAHCSAITVTSGAVVAMGAEIAKVGQTGQATAPHLHFELQRGSVYLNPIYYVEG